MTTYDRAGIRRTDDAWLAEVWSDPATRVVVMRGEQFDLTGDRVAWVSPQHAPDGTRIFLGLHDGVPHFAIITEAAPDAGPGSMLRQVATLLGSDEAGMMVHATALVQWLRNNRFCGACGAALEVMDAGHVLRCDRCHKNHFPRTDPAVIMLVTATDEHGVERALLGRQPTWDKGRYSTLAGFVDPGESLESAVAREVMEEAGIEVADVTYFGNQPWPFPASLMVGFYAHAVTTEIHVDGDELEDARWFTREEILDQSDTGEVALPGSFSIARALIEAWVGRELPGTW